MSVKCFIDTKYQDNFETKLKTMGEKEAIVSVLKEAYFDLNKSVNKVRSTIDLPEQTIDLDDLNKLIQEDQIQEDTVEFLDRLIELNNSKKDSNYTEGSPVRTRNFKKSSDKNSIEYSNNFKTKIQGLEKVVKTIIRNVESVSQKSAAVRGKEDQTSRNFKKVNKLINDLADIAPNLAIYKFIEFANVELSKLNSGLNKRIENGKIDSDYLFRANSYSSIYSSLDDIASTLNRQKNKKNIDKEEYDKIKLELGKARSRYKEFHANYVDAAREELTALLAPYNTMPYDSRRVELERQYNRIKPVKDKKSWIREKLLEEKDILETLQKEKTREILEEIPMDIANMESYITSEKNQNSLLIKLFSSVLDKADINIRNSALQLRNAFNENQAASPFKGNNNKAKYSEIVQQDDNGDHYLLGKYNPKFYSTKKKESLKLEKAKEEFGKGSKEYKEAKKNFTKWIKSNTVKTGTRELLPSEKWENKQYKSLSEDKKKYLKFLSDKIVEADIDSYGHKSLVIKYGGASFLRLPSVRKTDLDRILSGDKGIIKDKIGDFYKVRQDTTTQGELEDAEKPTSDELSYALTSVNNEERLLVPIHFRTKISPKDQSLDLPTIIMMNSIMAKEYKHKQSLEADSNLLLDVIGDDTTTVIKTESVTKRKVASYFSKDMVKPDIIRIPGKESNTYKKLTHMVENRVYNILDASGGKMSGSQVNVIANSVMKYTGDLTLMVNWMSAIPNMFQGKIQNFIEGVGGTTYSRKDLRWAEATYWAEMKKGGFGDIGKNINHNKLNLVSDHLNVLTDFSYTKHDFEKDNKFKALFNTHSLHAFNNMAEHYAQNTLMLAVMSNIKVLDKNGKFIKNDGTTTSNREEGMNLYEAYEIKDGVPSLNSKVLTTDYNPDQAYSDIGIVQVQNLIRKKIIDLHGQYDSKWQSTMQRYWFGKAISMFRKWMVPAFYRRWRGVYYVRKDFDNLTDEQKYYSLETREFEEGIYTSFIRFINNVFFKGLKELRIEIAKSKWESLTDYEKSNIHKTMRELLVTSMMIVGAMLTAMLAKEAPDDDEAEFMYTLAYILRRQEAELMQYYNPSDTLRIFRSPFAALNTLTKTTNLIIQLMPTNIGEQYETGDRKGQYKALVKAKKLVPVLSQTERSAEDSYNYLENLLTY